MEPLTSQLLATKLVTPLYCRAPGPPTAKRALRRMIYTVRSGDSLWRIAKLFKVKIEQILDWNSMSLSTPLLAGQKLTIRVAGRGG